MGDSSIKGRSPLLKGGRVGFSRAGPVGNLPWVRGTSRPGIKKAPRGAEHKEAIKQEQKYMTEKKIPFKKLKFPKKKWTKKDDAFVYGAAAGIIATEQFGKQGKAKKTIEKIKKLTTKEAVGTGDIGSVRNRRAGGGSALRGLGKAFMKGGKV